MNVMQLMAALEDALVRGIDPETTVVVEYHGDWKVIDRLEDPSLSDCGYLWFTLFAEEFASPSCTPGHAPGDDVELADIL